MAQDFATTTTLDDSHSVTRDQTEENVITIAEQDAIEEGVTLDSTSPLLWTSTKKLCHIVPVAMMVFAVTLGSSIISAGASLIEEEFHVSTVASILPFSVFTFGVGFGPAIGAPLSETVGRSAVYKVTGVLFCLFIMASALSPNFASLLVFRFLAGSAGGPCTSIIGGTAADLYPEHLRANTMIALQTAGFVGACVGPVVGGYTAQSKGWRWTQWVALLVAGLAVLLVAPTQETYQKAILKRQGKGNSQQTALARFRGMDRKLASQMLRTVLLRPLHMLVVEPIVTLFSLYSAFALGALYGFFASYPYVFREVYGFSAGETGLTFLSSVCGMIMAGLTAAVIQSKLYLPAYTKAGSQGLPPEYRLYGAMIGGLGMPIGLFWFAWTARPSIHWISPTLAGIPFAWGNLSVFITAALYLVNVYGNNYGASALASNGIARYTFAATFPLFTPKMYESLGVGWATSLFGFVSLALLPIPWVFFKYGKGIRARSQYVHSET